MTGRLTKSYKVSVKAVDDDQGLIEAYGSIFDIEDKGGDIVRPGSFKRTIKNSKSRVQDGKARFLIPMLWQHNEKQPIGGWYELEEDGKGLMCKGQIVLSTQLGKDAYELIKAGVINEFSIGYDIPKGGAFYDKSSGARNITELRLWEVSPVTFAMNNESLLVGVKGAQKDYNAAYQSAAAQDLLDDWYGVVLRALSSSITEALTGPNPESAVQECLSQFSDVVLSSWLPQALQAGLPELLMPYQDHYEHMSAQRDLERKAGRSISASNAEMIQAHCDGVKSMADEMKKNMHALHKALHSAADDLASRVAPQDSGKDPDEEEEQQQQDGKNTVVPSAKQTHNATTPRPSPEDTANEEEEQAAALLALLTK